MDDQVIALTVAGISTLLLALGLTAYWVIRRACADRMVPLSETDIAKEFNAKYHREPDADELSSVVIKCEFSHSMHAPDAPAPPEGFYLWKVRSVGANGYFLHRFYYRHGAPKPEQVHGPPTFREFLMARRMEQRGFMPIDDSTENLAYLTGYDGIGLWLNAEKKPPLTYTLKQPKHWARWIILASAAGILAATAMSDWVRV